MSSLSTNYLKSDRVSIKRHSRSSIDTDLWTHENDQNNENKQGPTRSSWIPILEGLIIGILLTGIVLAVILTIWLKPKMNTTISTSTIVGNILVTSTTTKTTTSVTATTTASTTTSSTTSTTTSSTTSTTTGSTTSTTTGYITSTTTSSTTSTKTSSTTSTKTSSTTSTTASSTTTTTTVTCLSGYVQTPSGSCVNTQTDFNNCGSVGYVCPSNYTSCSAGSCSTVPAVQLANGVGVPDWGSLRTIDDETYPISLPFSISMYNYSTSNVTVTSNGIVCLGDCSTAYTNGNLPDGNFGGPTAFAYWDDLMIYVNTSQTVYYGIGGQAPNRTAIFEFYESHIGAPSEYYHFQVIFYENAPGIVKYIYFETTDGGVSATVGVQKSAIGPAITYSVDQANALAGNLTLTFNTNTGIYTG